MTLVGTGKQGVGGVLKYGIRACRWHDRHFQEDRGIDHRVSVPDPKVWLLDCGGNSKIPHAVCLKIEDMI
jgi:hypothetical protein